MIADYQPPLRASRVRPRSRPRFGVRLLLAGVAIALLGWEVMVETPGPTTGTGAASVVVQPGDTLWGIASTRYPGDDVRERVSQILQLNGLRSAVIQPGEVLLLPAG